MPLFDRLVEAEVGEDRAEVVSPPVASPPAPAPASSRDSPGSREQPLTVSAALKAAGTALDRQVGVIWVEGEVAELSQSAAGHVYFTLKDETGQVGAVLWRSDAQRVRFGLSEGQRLRCRGRLGIYGPNGRFQFYVQAAEPAGLGAEALALAQLKAKLAGEGLFDLARKRPLPRLPGRIGVVTSRSGAALRDIIRVVQRRFPVPILLADAQVQGADAPRQIVAALAALARHRVDVVIVGRGGGSALDLSAFNDEAVVRAISACPVPVISAVGHETDVSLADLAADHRAATPSQAGEMAVPVLADLSAVLAKEEQRLDRELALAVRNARQQLEHLAGGAADKLSLALARRRAALVDLEKQLASCHPQARIAAHRAALREVQARAASAMRRSCEQAGRSYAQLAGRLDALSPLRVLERGYALALQGDQPITTASGLTIGDQVRVRLRSGAFDCRVEHIENGDDETEDDGNR
jgi:exodeoxyribonuclease VII large subunit